MACQIQTVREVAPYQILKRCAVHGLAWVENHTAGIGHSAHPNAATTVKVARMRLEYRQPVRCHGFVHDTAGYKCTDELDLIAAQACQCGGFHGSGPGPERTTRLFPIGSSDTP